MDGVFVEDALVEPRTAQMVRYGAMGMIGES